MWEMQGNGLLDESGKSNNRNRTEGIGQMKLYFVKDGEVVEREVLNEDDGSYLLNGSNRGGDTNVAAKSNVGTVYFPTPAAAIQAEVERAYNLLIEANKTRINAWRNVRSKRTWAKKKLAELKGGEGKE